MTPLGRDVPQGTYGRPKTRPKQALIRSDQQTALDHLARRLHDDRSVKGERITANTLLRVAIDGLIEHEDRLYGDNEVQLLASWREFLNLAVTLGHLEAVLSDWADKLNTARNGVGDPVSSSTLARVAVAGLTQHQSPVRGTTEAELLASWLRFLDERKATARR